MSLKALDLFISCLFVLLNKLLVEIFCVKFISCFSMLYIPGQDVFSLLDFEDL